MNTNTGEIIDWAKVAAMKDAGDPKANEYVEIPELLVAKMQGMNRRQRREFYRKNKKLFTGQAKGKS